jgi:hypothetical protein
MEVDGSAPVEAAAVPLPKKPRRRSKKPSKDEAPAEDDAGSEAAAEGEVPAEAEMAEVETPVETGAGDEEGGRRKRKRASVALEVVPAVRCVP